MLLYRFNELDMDNDTNGKFNIYSGRLIFTDNCIFN